MKSCIFCKAELGAVGRAREHIAPKWLQKEWNLSDEIKEPTHYDADLNVLSQRKHTLDSLLAGNVCYPCNNGWMSALEAKCKPLILDLAQGRKRLLELNDSEAGKLARWTVKTAFVLHASSNYRRIVPDNHIFKLDSESVLLPDSVVVVGHNFNSSRVFSWAQGSSWEMFQRRSIFSATEIQNLYESGYKIALRIGGLFLMVAYNPLVNSRFCLWKRKHIPLYPRKGPVVWRESAQSWPPKADVRFYIFYQTLGIGRDYNQADLPPA